MIRAGRPAYNSAILATGDEQLLQNIVRTRFYDSVGFLAVASVTANVAVTASATVQAGFGPSGNYAGNLVPFSPRSRIPPSPIYLLRAMSSYGTSARKRRWSAHS